MTDSDKFNMLMKEFGDKEYMNFTFGLSAQVNKLPVPASNGVVLFNTVYEFPKVSRYFLLFVEVEYKNFLKVSRILSTTEITWQRVVELGFFDEDMKEALEAMKKMIK